MVIKESQSVWIPLPLNFGSERLNEFTDWASAQANLYSLPSTWLTPSTTTVAAATVGAAMGLWWMWSKSSSSHNGGGHRITPLVNPDSQTRELLDGSRVCRYVTGDVLMRSSHQDATTVYEAVQRGMRLAGKNGHMLGYRKADEPGQPYHWLSYGEVVDRSLNAGRSMRALGQAVGPDTFIGIYSKNRPEWVIVEHATYAFSNVLVPLYDTLGPDACVFIINQAQIQLVVCDAEDKVSGLLKKRAECPSLKYIVLIDGPPPSRAATTQPKGGISEKLISEAKEAGIQLISFVEFESLGREKSEVADMAPVPPSADDLATICYTSGTTGVPKGVMLTHGNVMADCTTIEYFKHSNMRKDDVMFSFLPLAHMFERVMETCVFTEGGSVGFFRGDIRLLLDDIKELRPTVMPVVPRVLNRLYDRVMSEANKSSISRFVLDTALAMKSRELSNWVIRDNSLVDKLIFKKIRACLGGRLRLMITGSAPLSETVLTFVRCALGCPVIEGYGQTECVAACTVTIEGDFTPGHVGVPSPCNAVKLVDVPELGYFAAESAGEVCIKGTNVFRGYYKMPEQTAEALDADGWLHTGDIGRWTERGTLKIVDRKKHIFKLAQGEYVAPEKIENVYMRSQYVAQCFVYGESLKSSLVGVMVPDAEVLMAAVRDQLLQLLQGVNTSSNGQLSTEEQANGSLPNGTSSNHHQQQSKKPQRPSLEELCRSEEVRKLIFDDLIAVGRKAGLHSFEQVKAIHLSAEAFSMENELLTPTLKSKRPNLKVYFSEAIQDMYKGVP